MFTIFADSSYYKVYKWICDIIAFMTETSASVLNNKMNDATDLLFSNTIIDTIVTNVMLPLGVTLLVLYFMLDLYDLAIHDNFSLEQFFKCFVKFLAFFMILINVKFVFEGIVGISQWTTEEILSGYIESTMSIPEFAHLDKDANKWEFLIAIFETITGAVDASTDEIFSMSSFGIIESLIFAIVVYIETWYLAFDRAISLGIYYIFAPISLSDIAGNGLSPSSVAFIKKVIAVAMRQPIAVILILYLPDLNKAYYETPGIGLPFLSVAIILLVRKLLKNVRTYSEDIFINGSIS